MSAPAIPQISPLSMNQLTRDLWSQYDASAIWQLAPLGKDSCYTLKFYKAPDDQEDLFDADGFVLLRPPHHAGRYHLRPLPAVHSGHHEPLGVGTRTVHGTDYRCVHEAQVVR